MPVVYLGCWSSFLGVLCFQLSSCSFREVVTGDVWTIPNVPAVSKRELDQQPFIAEVKTHDCRASSSPHNQIFYNILERLYPQIRSVLEIN